MRVLLIALLLLATSPAWARWVALGDTPDGVYYYDPATIRKNGNRVRVWMVVDFKQRRKEGERSRRWLTEYDCKEERYRFLVASKHTEPVAGGRTLSYKDTPTRWGHIPPESVAEEVFRIVCR